MRVPSVLAAVAAVLILAATPAWAEEVSPPSPEAIEKARTAADHTAIADAYTRQAAALRQKAAEHKAMAASYEKGPGYLKEKSGLEQHCHSLIKYFEGAAAEAEALAKTHRAMANTAPR